MEPVDEKGGSLSECIERLLFREKKSDVIFVVGPLLGALALKREHLAAFRERSKSRHIRCFSRKRRSNLSGYSRTPRFTRKSWYYMS